MSSSLAKRQKRRRGGQVFLYFPFILFSPSRGEWAGGWGGLTLELGEEGWAVGVRGALLLDRVLQWYGTRLDKKVGNQVGTR